MHTKQFQIANTVHIMHQTWSQLLRGSTHQSIRHTVIFLYKILILEWKFETCFQVMKPALWKYYFHIFSGNPWLKATVFKSVLFIYFLLNCTPWHVTALESEKMWQKTVFIKGEFYMSLGNHKVTITAN